GSVGNRLQTPTLIGCMFLMIPQTSAASQPPLPLCPAAISEASNYDTVFGGLSKKLGFSLILFDCA
ncbi:MAG: hypothetical protein AB7S86_14380, partial [Hydrogenophaga sp.]|uniref:hypothetical protein n=1 Tax=Hydrogenophaga sp. TaxID=1904254 RepID=UPI003D0966BD